MAFTNILPDPNNNIANDGSSGGTGNAAGPGYASVSFKSNFPRQISTTNSGSTIIRNVGGHSWQINITYNPLTRAQFEPLNAFLMQKKGSTSHFFVELPQYKTPQDSNFNGFAHVNALVIQDATNRPAGADTMLLGRTSAGEFAPLGGSHGKPSVGDVFSVVDTSNTNHKKVYMVTRVETNTDNTGGGVTANQVRIHFTPPLQKLATKATSTIKFKNVQFKVINKSSDSNYGLDVNGLYKLSLNLQESQT